METENKNYAVTELGNEHTIKLSPKMYKTAVSSLGIGAVLFVGACGYSIYSLLNSQSNQEAITEMQQASEMQQEQLLTLSKKAASLSEELQNLTQMETELRIQAGVKPPKDVEEKLSETEDTESGTSTSNENSNTEGQSNESTQNDTPNESENQFNGQGGPISELNFSDVEEALTMLETDMKIRRDSLEELQTLLKAQREQMSMVIAGQPVGSNIAEMISNALGGSLSANSTTPSIWPATGVVTSPYGLRWEGSDFHPGIDIANDLGTPIVATADGTVDYAGWDSGGYGNMVDINHGNGIMTRYGHASQVLVSAGQQVKRGQTIALMGSTGFSTGPHVHYEIHVNGQRVNPVNYL